jgi:hypothetical protein
MVMRHPIPDIVSDYDRLIAQGPPRCCHTCEFYDIKGMCTAFFMEPPEAFAATPSECPEYENEAPF